MRSFAVQFTAGYLAVGRETAVAIWLLTMPLMILRPLVRLIVRDYDF